VQQLFVSAAFFAAQQQLVLPPVVAAFAQQLGTLAETGPAHRAVTSIATASRCAKVTVMEDRAGRQRIMETDVLSACLRVKVKFVCQKYGFDRFGTGGSRRRTSRI